MALRCAVRSMSRPGSRMASRAASRAVSRAVSRRPSVSDLTNPEELETTLPVTTSAMSDDAFEQILDVTTHQEALMAYYYLDDNNEVCGSRFIYHIIRIYPCIFSIIII